MKILSIVAGILFLLGFVPYIKAIRQGTAKPSKVTWFVWAVLNSIVLGGMYTKDSLNGQIVGAGLTHLNFLLFKRSL